MFKVSLSALCFVCLCSRSISLKQFCRSTQYATSEILLPNGRSQRVRGEIESSRLLLKNDRHLPSHWHGTNSSERKSSYLLSRHVICLLSFHLYNHVGLTALSATEKETLAEIRDKLEDSDYQSAFQILKRNPLTQLGMHSLFEFYCFSEWPLRLKSMTSFWMTIYLRCWGCQIAAE